MKQLLALVIIMISLPGSGQSTFSPEAFMNFREENSSLTAAQLLQQNPPQTTYYSSRKYEPDLGTIPWFDSIDNYFQFTDDEKKLLKENYFMVSERIAGETWLFPFIDVYSNDFPLFLSTDFILHTLHYSYDELLKRLEAELLEPGLKELIDAMYVHFPDIYDKYSSNKELMQSLEDADLYIAVAKSLIYGVATLPQIADEETYNQVMDAINSYEQVDMPLFTRNDLARKLDFSQFEPRGHYTDQLYFGTSGVTTLEDYFRAMMWLGRIDFLMTPPPDNPWEDPWRDEDILRMNLSALILNEVLHKSGKSELMERHEKIISFMVGPDDNLTPAELDQLSEEFLDGPEDLLNESTFNLFLEKLNSSDDYGQKIMSNFFYVDPDATDPGELPVSFKLLGQKFLIDSYIFSEVVFDRIVFEDQKMYRMLPDPLDVFSVLGNEDAMKLMEPEMETYKYAYKISELQYLIEAYDDDFWTQSLYNTWLNALIKLNPQSTNAGLPYFMKTVAWHHEKLNTQLTSWAQLRHDNILYGKQSYTGGTGCSYPYTYVEPYPEFFEVLETFAEHASQFFVEVLPASKGDLRDLITDFFDGYSDIMQKLGAIAQKQIYKTPLNDADMIFLKTMINDYMVSGPGVSGWINEMIFPSIEMWDSDFTVADVHTQPTEPDGSRVGNVLHVGNGMINMGVFLAPCSTNPEQIICYTGPVASFHTQIEKDWNRLNDNDWKDLFYSNTIPVRPSWAYAYLADMNGEYRETEQILKGVEYPHAVGLEQYNSDPGYMLLFPNPASEQLHIRMMLPFTSQVEAVIFDISGRKVKTAYRGSLSASEHDIAVSLDEMHEGIYMMKLRVNGKNYTKRFIVR